MNFFIIDKLKEMDLKQLEKECFSSVEILQMTEKVKTLFFLKIKNFYR